MNFLKGLLIFSLLLPHTIKAGDDRSKEIIRKAVEAYGGDKFERADIAFKFRSKMYEANLDAGLYEYKRISENDGEIITDILNNDGFSRLIDGEESLISQLWSDRYSSSVNSVIYFALLPFKLTDEAVRSEYLGKIKIKNQDYYKVRVTFSENSGGEDYEDVFIYWFSTRDYSMDYLAYSYMEKEVGLRFREAYNKREINGLVFQDYNNYKANPDKYKLEELDSRFNEDRLELLSKIELQDISVEIK